MCYAQKLLQSMVGTWKLCCIITNATRYTHTDVWNKKCTIIQANLMGSECRSWWLLYLRQTPKLPYEWSKSVSWMIIFFFWYFVHSNSPLLVIKMVGAPHLNLQGWLVGVSCQIDCIIHIFLDLVQPANCVHKESNTLVETLDNKSVNGSVIYVVVWLCLPPEQVTYGGDNYGPDGCSLFSSAKTQSSSGF